MIKVAVIDDKVGNRNIIRDKLLRHGHFQIVLSAEDGSDFIEKMKALPADQLLKALPADQLPDVALMDLEMPNMDGVDAIALGSSFFPSVKFVVLTIFDDEEKIFKAIKAGAFGYLLKDESAENISDMLWQMHESGAGPISPGIAHKILQLVQNNRITLVQKKPQSNKNSQLFDLTNRETEILTLVVQGLDYKAIGARLFISPNTSPFIH